MNCWFGIRRPADLLAIAVLAFGFYHLAGAALIEAKARLAPILVEQAWRESRQQGTVGFKPWSWADTWPVARLRVPEHAVNQLVLAGDSGHALAFGPGHTPVSAAPGTSGTIVVSGHRDTHFSFLRDLATGQRITLELATGASRRYVVESLRIVDSRKESLPLSSSLDRLLLVTCYPFESLAVGGPLRYVVSAVPESMAQEEPSSLL